MRRLFQATPTVTPTLNPLTNVSVTNSSAYSNSSLFNNATLSTAAALVLAAADKDKCPQTTVGKLFYRLVVFDYLLEIAMAALVPLLKVSIRRCIARCSQDDEVAKALEKARDTDVQDLDPEQRELIHQAWLEEDSQRNECDGFVTSRTPSPSAGGSFKLLSLWVGLVCGSTTDQASHRALSHAGWSCFT